MIRWIAVTYLLIGCVGLAAGQITPGGVQGPVLWLKTDSSAKPVYHQIAKNKDSLIVIGDAPSNKLFNFNQSLVFNGADTLSVMMGDSILNHCTLFTVYQPFDLLQENVLWHIVKKKVTTVVLTNNRAADLTTNQYMSFRDFFPTYPKISIYSQQMKDSVPVTQYWNIGYKPALPRLPVVSFSGLMPELIAYDRILDGAERLQVGSYLAVKYGVTLYDPEVNYVNSLGEIIWTGAINPSFHHHVAGLARDDGSALNQLKSSSSEMPGLLTLTSADTLANRNALVWGDNNQAMKGDKAKSGLPPFLKKTWLFVKSGTAKTLRAEIAVNTHAMDAPLPDKPVYWMGIDSTASVRPDAKTMQLIRMDHIDEQGNAHFGPLVFKNGSCTGFFAIAGELLFTTAITGPTCGSIGTGYLDIKLAGGVAPYQITLSNNSGQIISRRTLADKKKMRFDRVSTGNYTVSAQDALQNSYSQTVYVNNADGPNPVSVADEYTLPANGSCLTIRADSAMTSETTYRWIGPGDFAMSGPVAELCKPGTYTLIVSNDNCQYQKTITVNPSDNAAKMYATIWPNPSTNGNYTVSVSLPERVPLEMSVFTATGILVSKQKGNGITSQYSFTGRFGQSGPYFFSFTAGKYQGSLKLIVVQ